MKLILVRYGEHQNGHLSEKGKKEMFLVAEKLESLVKNKKCCIICAKIPRAVESGEIISKKLNLSPVKSFAEFYAADEDNIPINVNKAKEVLDNLGKEFDVVVAVISREYIEEFGGKSLSRGEFLALDYKV